MSCHYFLASIVWWWEASIHSIVVPVWHFFGCFQDFLFLWFSAVWLLLLCEVFFGFSYLGFADLLDQDLFVFVLFCVFLKQSLVNFLKEKFSMDYFSLICSGMLRMIPESPESMIASLHTLVYSTCYANSVLLPL